MRWALLALPYLFKSIQVDDFVTALLGSARPSASSTR
jgi:hypothetical protein